jgi:hypothetical protein
MEYFFSIKMTNEEYLPYYRGQIQAIVATTNQGVKVQFPAMHLRQYVTSAGVRGYFCMKTQNNKFLSLTKIR